MLVATGTTLSVFPVGCSVEIEIEGLLGLWNNDLDLLSPVGGRYGPGTIWCPSREQRKYRSL
uniref:Uncharacterized protein n=1 Tax=Lepeophtheirus salmonis TaxID=72036 RepID=A0A0K2TN49_LEPSM